MSEEMIDRARKLIAIVMSHVKCTEAGATWLHATDAEDEVVAVLSAYSPNERLRDALDLDVRRRLERVAMTLETCGAHGIPIDFAMLASDIRAALVPDDRLREACRVSAQAFRTLEEVAVANLEHDKARNFIKLGDMCRSALSPLPQGEDT